MALFRCQDCGRARAISDEDLYKPCENPMCGGIMERMTLAEILAEAKARREQGETNPDGPQ